MPIRKSNVGGVTPSGTTADRPANPSVGDQFYNGTLGILEIYTASGWVSATGANDFNISVTGPETSVTLNKEYFSGSYTIASALSDLTFDVYLFDNQGNAAGYTGTPSIVATSNFNKVVILGGTTGDLLSFSYKTTFVTTAITDEPGVGPVIKSILVADLPNIDDTTVITGVNFAEDIQITFTGTNNIVLPAKSVVRSSATSLIVTRPDENFLENYSPYTVTATNPGITPPTGSNGHIATNAITAGGDPVWVTPEGELDAGQIGSLYSFTLNATDPDGGSVEYSISTGQLPTGLSLNSSTGVISGTFTEPQQFVVSATDSSGNVTNRQFEIVSGIVSSGLTAHIDFSSSESYSGSGSTITDLSGNNADLTLFGSGYSYDGVTVGGHMSFNGNGAARNTTANLAQGNSARTVGIWFRTSGDDDILVCVGSGGVANEAFAIATNPTNNAFLYGYIGAYDETSIPVGAPFSDGVWKYVTVTWDAQSTGTLNYYINGVFAGSRVRSTGEAYATAAGWWIAGWIPSQSDRYLVGDIGEAQVYNRVLSSQEIQANFDASRARFGV